nr:hypothetical protein [uncultured Prevotella sp.]
MIIHCKLGCVSTILTELPLRGNVITSRVVIVLPLRGNTITTQR